MDINEDTFLVIELPPKNEYKSKIEHNKKMMKYANIKKKLENFIILLSLLTIRILPT
jgi:hypothetical protein